MARVTGGEVTYMERRKIGDYEHKEAKAVLSFSLDDGDDHESTLNTLIVTAKRRVHEMLGLTPRSEPQLPATMTTTTDVANRLRKAPVEDKPTATMTSADLGLPVKRGPGRPPRVDAAKPAEAPVTRSPLSQALDGLVEAASPVKPVEVKDDPVAPGFAAAVAALPAIDDIDALLAEPEIKKIEPDPVTEVTDAMLTSEVTKVMKKINNPVAIKDVIRKTLMSAGITNTTGKQLRDIPMPYRPAFVEALGAI